MRDKEAMEIEKKNLAKSLEKQGKAVEKLVDTEHSLKAQIVSLSPFKYLIYSTYA
jgi:E3 ubiquitin-protein ligase BRE1